VGSLRALLPGLTPADLSAALDAIGPATIDLVSPLAPSHNLARVLDGVVHRDIFGDIAAAPVTRAEAMTVPAVARARHIICGTTGAVPLRRFRGATPLPPEQQGWASQTTGAVPAYHRAVWTADDLLFYGWSCWSRVNGSDGFPRRMDRVPMGRWSVDDAGRVLIDALDGRGHRLVDQSTVLLLPGPHEGILTSAAATIRHAADLQRAAWQAAKTPAAYLGLRQTQGTPLQLDSDDPNVVTVNSTVADWRAARAGLNGGVAFIPLGIEAVELGTFSEHLLTEGRNAAAVDIARVCSLPADLLDAAGPSSLTYANARDNDSRAIQYGVGLYLLAISAVLSADAVCPHGQSARFDLEEWLHDPTPTTPPATPARSRPPALEEPRP
jgi:Phage portal protein